jgi:hypothetical protein
MTDLRPFAAQGRFVLWQGKRWLKDLMDQHLALAPTPGGKTAGWLVGHLAVTGDFGRRLCGLKPMCSKEWRALFNPGSFPSLDPSSYPGMNELRSTMLDVYRDLLVQGPDATAELLAQPNPYTPAIEAFPTSGDFAAYLMTGHLAHHLGQLSAWRIAAGLSSGAEST